MTATKDTYNYSSSNSGYRAESMAPPGTLTEDGDAGDIPLTAQPSDAQPFGSPLGAITGTIASDSDQDMFMIVIDDPDNFSASTDNPETVLSVDDDTMLFLFDAEGLGVLANDDTAANAKSRIPIGSLAGAPDGVYFLSISIFFNTPVSSGGEIFDVTELGGAAVAVGANGPGGDLPVTGWDVVPAPSQTGPYRIDLTGATFVPEPSMLALQMSGLALVGLARGSRFRRTS